MKSFCKTSLWTHVFSLFLTLLTLFAASELLSATEGERNQEAIRRVRLFSRKTKKPIRWVRKEEVISRSVLPKSVSIKVYSGDKIPEGLQIRFDRKLRRIRFGQLVAVPAGTSRIRLSLGTGKQPFRKAFSFRLGERAPTLRLVQPVVTSQEGSEGIPGVGLYGQNARVDSSGLSYQVSTNWEAPEQREISYVDTSETRTNYSIQCLEPFTFLGGETANDNTLVFRGFLPGCTYGVQIMCFNEDSFGNTSDESTGRLTVTVPFEQHTRVECESKGFSFSPDSLACTYPCITAPLPQGGCVLSGTPTPTATSTPTPTRTPSLTPTRTPTQVPTNTPSVVVPTPTRTSTPVPPPPTSTPTRTATATPSVVVSPPAAPSAGIDADISDSDMVPAQRQCGSVIEVENQTLGESVPLAGTGEYLSYSTLRVPGREANRTVTVPLLGSTYPSAVTNVRLTYTVASKTQTQTIPAAANLSTTFVWDGKDNVGVLVYGTRTLAIKMEYLGSTGSVLSTTNTQVPVSHLNFLPQSIGGWSLSSHHWYDTASKYIYFGYGGKAKANPLNPGKNINEIVIVSRDGSEAYRFNAQGRHLDTRDTVTGTTLVTFGYNTAGFLTSATDPFTNKVTIERDTANKPTAIVAPFGQRTTLTTDTAGYVTSVTDPASRRYSFVYGTGGLLTTFTNPRNLSSTLTYDTKGNLTKDTDALASFLAFGKTGTSDNYTVTQTTAMSRVASISADNRNTNQRIRTYTDIDSTKTTATTWNNNTVTTWSFPGFSSGRQEWAADPRFGLESPLTKLAQVTLQGGRVIKQSENVAVSPAWDPNVDPLVALGQLQTFSASASRTGSTTETATSTFTKSTKTLDFTSPQGRTSQVILDGFGRPVTEKSPGLVDVTTAYDTRGRVASVTAGTRSVAYAYDLQGFLSQVTEPLNRVTKFTYNTGGDLTQVTLPNGQSIGYGYDANGNLTSLTPPGRGAHLFTYDNGDGLASYKPPTGTNVPTGSTVYAYNKDKQIVSITPPTGAINFTYLEPKGYLSGVSTTFGTKVGYGYDTTGKVTSITSSRPSTTSQNLAITYQENAVPYELQWSGTISGKLGATYDQFLRPATQTVLGTLSIGYTYDKDGLLTKVGELTLIRSATNGSLLGTSLTGGVTDAYTYNTFGEVTQYEAKFGTTVLFRQVYTRDALGRITEKQELVDGVTTTWGYGYDSGGRLTNVTRNGTSYASYGYDFNGNRTSVTRSGVTKTASYDAHDRLISDGETGYSFSYDDSGMLKSRTKGSITETFAYDEFGVLTSTSIGGVSYVVDGANRRVGKRKGTGIVQGFLYQDQLRPAAELGASNVIVNRFVYADRANIPSYFVRSSKLYRVIADHLGSPRVVVDAATGAVVQRLDFDEFGRVLKDTSPGFQPFGFAGGIYDQDTKLVRFGGRDYDPAIGRWTSKDPIGFAGGDTNLYGYVLQDPVNFIDPNGEDAADAFFAGMMDGVSFGGFSYLMGSMGMMNRVDDPCAYRVGEYAAVASGFAALTKAMVTKSVALGARAAQRGAIGASKSWKSVPAFGHAFSRHGEGKKITQALMDRARGKGIQQGQWLNNEAAAEMLGRLNPNAIVEFQIPSGLGQVISPDGTILPATMARAIPNPAGTGWKSAFPILAGK